MNTNLWSSRSSRHDGSRHYKASSARRNFSRARPQIYPLEAVRGSEASTSQPRTPLVTLEEVQLAAQRRGLELSVKDLGPFYRVVCRNGGADGQILGVTNGFVAPWFGGIMHCDMLQIFTRGLKGDAGERIRGGLLGLGLLLGGATFAYGYRRGCRTAEILAINDDDAWHERLVRYYSYFGFRTVCKVGGNGLADVPHMLVWGGEGTRMDADIEEMLRRWTPALRSQAAAAAAATAATAAAEAVSGIAAGAGGDGSEAAGGGGGGGSGGGSVAPPGSADAAAASGAGASAALSLSGDGGGGAAGR
ncbi:hypothetical protein PLESTB_001714300 [Pleodorina starrii]|uniref:Uncharacterized protein n=1 Tax=Pleodorina starrii TaxID=330485 RepID=A0A9W6F9X8_9CHLO|nr:hypothetical protein PLESTM_000790300 [Pleodorina starrii]GLC61081.1 hypothetical protein PLESTB_001714300 [Pleodorina starrii]GLC75879.1 hypothetical protein PLESTF_001699700 [Pleodorina starrii]